MEKFIAHNAGPTRPHNDRTRWEAPDMMSLVSVTGLVLLYGPDISLYTMMIRSNTFHPQAARIRSSRQLPKTGSVPFPLYTVEDRYSGKVGGRCGNPPTPNPKSATSAASTGSMPSTGSIPGGQNASCYKGLPVGLEYGGQRSDSPAQDFKAGCKTSFLNRKPDANDVPPARSARRL